MSDWDNFRARLFGSPKLWNDPRIRQFGERFAEEALDFATELYARGAEPLELLAPYQEKNLDRPDVCIPPAFADALTALLLALPRSGERPGPRTRWSLKTVLDSMASGVSQRKAARMESSRTGVSAATIERVVRDHRAAFKKPPHDKSD
jgi:hypothetical protein